MTEKSSPSVLNEAFKYYRLLQSYGGSDFQFRKFLKDKFDDPKSIYSAVIARHKKENEEAVIPKNRNEPFKTHVGLRTHLFAKRLCIKILEANVLFRGAND